MSTREEKIQLATEVDSSGALQGLKRIEDGAAGMARAVSDSASKAGAGIDAMGTSGAQASAKLDANTRSIVASIQRATAAAEAGEKGTAKFFESLGRQRGADVGALQPYLQQLEQARQRTDSLTISTGQYTNALRMVPAQMTDVVTSLASGQDPLLVLIQQGGQLKDQFGGVREAAKAVGGYVMGLVNPFTVLAAAAGGIAIAYEAGAREERAFRNALILSGNQAGTTAGQLQQMAVGIDAVVGTQGRAAEALAQFAQGGKVGAQNLEAFAAAALRFEDVAGQAVSETVQQFAELGKAPLDATLKLNEGTGYLTASVYAQIKALTEQGKVTEAANVAQKAYADTLAQRATEMEKNLGLVERGWKGIGKAVAETWDAIKSVGRTVGPEGQLAASQAALTALEQQAASRRGRGLATGDLDRQIEATRQAVDMRREEVRLLDRAARLQADQVAQVKARAEFDKAGERFLSDRVKMEREIAAARELGARAGQSLVQIEERIAAIRKSYDKPAGGSGMAVGESEVAGIRARVIAAQRELRELQAQAANPDGLVGKVQQTNEGERLAIKLKEELATGIKGVARANKEQALAQAEVLAQTLSEKAATEEHIKQILALNDVRAKELQAIGADATAIERKALALEAENEVWGKSRVAIEAATLARMEANAADVALFDGSAQVVAALNAKTAAQRRYVEALQAAELKTFSQRGDEVLRQAQELRDTYADELRMVGLSAVEREKIVAVRQVELKYAKLIADVERSSLSDAEKRAQIGKLVEAQGIESSAVVNRVLQQDFARTSAQIEQSLTDALMRGFESGKDFAEVLRDTVVNMFKTMVLRPVIQGVVQGGLSAVGLGGPAAGGGGLLGTVNNLSSLYNTGSTVAGWLGLGAATGTGLAATAGTGMALAGTSAGLGLTASAGTGLGLAGAGTGLGLSATAGAGTALTAGTGAAGGAAGGLAGMGPYGWAALAVLAVLGSGFGKTPGEQHMGGYYSSSGKEANLDNAMAVTGGGGWDDGAWARDLIERPDAGLKSFTQLTVDAVLDSAKNSAKALGLDIALGIDAGFAANLNGKGTDKNAFGYAQIFANGELAGDYSNRELGSDMTAAGQKFAAELSDAAAKVLLAGTDFGRTGETASQTLARLGGSLTTVNTVFDTLGETAYAASLAGADLASQLADAFGGLENLTALTSSYYEAYYSEAERAATTTRQVTEALADLGLGLPATREQYRALVEAQDLSTESGRKNYAALLQLAPAFASVTEAVTQTASGITTAATQARDAAFKQLQASVDAEKALWQRQADGASALRDEVAAVFDILSEGVNSLRAEALGPVAAAARGQDTIQQALASARAGLGLPDADALANAIGAARGGMGMENYASLAEQQFAQLKLAGDLDELSRFAGDQLNEAERQLLVAQQQMEALDQTLVYWRDMLTRADTGTEVNRAGYVSVVDAIAELQEAIKPGSTGRGRQQQASGSNYMMGTGSYGGAVDFTTTAPDAGGRDILLSREEIMGGQLAYNVNNRTDYETAQSFLTASSWLGGADAATQAMLAAGATQAQADEAARVAAEYESWKVSTGGVDKGADSFLTYIGSDDPRYIPKYEVGTNYVPRDGLAYLHEGEAVVPKAYNPVAGGMAHGISTQRLEALVEGLTAEVQRLQAVVNDGNHHQRRSADLLDNVTEGGAGMRTLAA